MRTVAALAAVLVLTGSTAAVAAPAAPGAAEVLRGVPLAPERATDEAVAESVHDIATSVRDIFLTVEGIEDGSTDVTSSTRRELTLSADVLFAFGSADLAPASAAGLVDVVAAAEDGAIASVTVEGHTDSVGDEAANVALSQRRAEAVRAALAPQLPPVPFTVVGRGEAEPVAPNTRKDGSDDPAARARNRRVVVTVAR